MPDHHDTAAPVPMPLRVLVKGASTVVWTSWMGGPRSDLAYPRGIEAELRAAGVPADVHVAATPGERVNASLRNWEREIVAWSPDVVVLDYSHYETIHVIVPWWFERHANSIRRRPGRVREAYRTFLLRKLYMLVAQIQWQIDVRTPPYFTNRPARVKATLTRLVERIRSVGSPLVLVVDHLPPASTFDRWFPGMAERIEIMNDVLADLVADFDDPGVQFVSVRKLAGDTPVDELTPDGAHYTPEFHRRVGAELAGHILHWRREQADRGHMW